MVERGEQSIAITRSCGLPVERLSDQLRITVPDRGLAWAWINNRGRVQATYTRASEPSPDDDIRAALCRYGV